MPITSQRMFREAVYIGRNIPSLKRCLVHIEVIITDSSTTYNIIPGNGSNEVHNNILLTDLVFMREDVPVQNIYSPEDTFRSRAMKFGKWFVDTNGDMSWDNRFFINADQVVEQTCIVQMFKHEWIDFNEFMPAYFQALKNKKCQYVNVQIHY